MRELAGAIGVSHRALYRHFADREALLDELAVRTTRALHGAMLAAAGEPATPRARLEAAIDAYVRFAFRRPRAYGHAMRAGIARSSAPAAVREAARGLGRDVGALYAATVAAAGSAVVDEPDCEHDSMALWGAVHGLVDLYLGGMLRARTRDLARAYILDLVARHHLPAP